MPSASTSRHFDDYGPLIQGLRAEGRKRFGCEATRCFDPAKAAPFARAPPSARLTGGAVLSRAASGRRLLRQATTLVFQAAPARTWSAAMRGRLPPQTLPEHPGKHVEHDLRKPVDTLGHTRGIVHLRSPTALQPISSVSSRPDLAGRQTISTSLDSFSRSQDRERERDPLALHHPPRDAEGRLGAR